jgi:hypothetical protein
LKMDRYFKYLDGNGARPTLTNRTLRWSRPSRFNDLFDMAQPYSIDFDAEFVTRRALELMWERLENPGQQAPKNKMGAVLEVARPFLLQLGREEFDRDMRIGLEESLAKHPARMEAFGAQMVEHLRTIKVLCLSSVNDDNALWGLYADHHRGVVLEFANMPGLDSVYRCARPVDYRDNPPPLLTDEELAQFYAGNLELTPDLADPLMFLKSSHWSYEKELRIVTGEGRYPDSDFEDIWFHPRELVAVYFGAKGDELRAELEPLVIERYPHAQRWQASKGKQFRIEFTRLDGLPA